MKVIRVISFFFVAVGIVLLLFGVREFRAKKAFISIAKPVTGTVTEVIKRQRSGSKGSTTTVYHYRIAYEVQGQGNFEFVSDSSHSSPEYKVTDAVPVLYIPGKPELAEINTISLLWFKFGLLTVLGFCFAGAGACNLWITELSPPQGIRTEANLRELKQAYRSGRLTRNSEYQGLLVAFTFVGFALLGAAVMILIFAGTFTKVIVTGLVLYVVIRIILARRKKSA